jgi:uncharacterized cofD-like protein
VTAASRVLAVRGSILPSSLDDIELCAEVRYGSGPEATATLVCGQSRIAASGGVVERVFLRPDRVKAHPEAIRALLHADLIVLGPGSLYTSIMPNLLIREIGDAVRASAALRIYVCNVATQPGETSGYDLDGHIRALSEHAGGDVWDLALANGRLDLALPAGSGSEMVVPRCGDCPPERVIVEDLVDLERPWRHDPARLAAAILRAYEAHVAGQVGQGVS